jgi:hypothetical protein
MKPATRQARLREEHEAAKYQFVLIELDLAITFGNMALSSNDESKTQRNARNAKRAYQAARRFCSNALFTEKMKLEMKGKLTEVQLLLRRLNSRRQYLRPGHA